MSEMRESANRTERELSHLATEICSVCSASAAARETLSRRMDDEDDQLTQNERDSARLSAEVEALRRRSDDAHEQTAAHKDDNWQLKGRVDQQRPSPMPARHCRSGRFDVPPFLAFPPGTAPVWALSVPLHWRLLSDSQ
jgi:hypothetical protein